MTKDEIKYLRYLDTLSHHEILPNRLYLIQRIKKAIDIKEKEMYKKRYELLNFMYENKSWTDYARKL